jgi:hypothetical protein
VIVLPTPPNLCAAIGVAAVLAARLPRAGQPALRNGPT